MITQIFPENLQELDWEHGDFKDNVKKLEEYIRYMRERIEYNGGQNSKRISLVVSDENGGKLNEAQIIAAINEGKSIINLSANRVAISSDYFELTEDGKVTAKGSKSVSFNYNSITVSYYLNLFDLYNTGTYVLSMSEWDSLDVNGDGKINDTDYQLLMDIAYMGASPISNVWKYEVSLNPSDDNGCVIVKKTCTSNGVSKTPIYSYFSGSSKTDSMIVEDIYANKYLGRWSTLKSPTTDYNDEEWTLFRIMAQDSDTSVNRGIRLRMKLKGNSLEFYTYKNGADRKRVSLSASGLSFYDENGNLTRTYSAT